MSFELKGVWSTRGTPKFETKEDLELARELARMSPYNLRWDKWTGGFTAFVAENETCFETYVRFYGPAAADALDRSRTDDCNGFLVVSNTREWALPGAMLIQPDPIPEVVSGPGQVKIQTPWGSLLQNEAAYIQQILGAAVFLSPESLKRTIKQLNTMLEE